MGRLLTRQQVADYLVISVRGVDRLRKSGRLPAIRVGRGVRFLEDTVKAFVESQTKQEGGNLDPDELLRRWK